MQNIGRFTEFDISNRSFEEFADLARTSIESIDRSSSIEYLEPPWNPTANHFTEPKSIFSEHEIRQLTPIELQPLRDGSPVAAIDASILDLGETQHGALYAIRGTAVSRESKRYRYSRLGPLLFHIKTGENRVANEHSATHLKLPLIDTGAATTNACKELLTVFETILKTRVAKKYNDAILLWDGSLTVPAGEGETRAANMLLELARARGNSIVGISKKTQLFLLKEMTDLMRGHKTPCLIDIDHAIQRTQRLLLLGKVYVAKLTCDGLPFRLDVDRELPETDRITTVEKMIGNDLTQDGYPETLRLAHILSKFNAAEVIGMHRFLDENYGFRVIEYPSIRRILFGPFAGNRSLEPEINLC